VYLQIAELHLQSHHVVLQSNSQFLPALPDAETQTMGVQSQRPDIRRVSALSTGMALYHLLLKYQNRIMNDIEHHRLVLCIHKLSWGYTK
jgi:hypothetical protein